MTNRLIGLVATTLFFLIAGCADDHASWKETDMMKYGLPIKMKVPEGVEVLKSSVANSDEFKLTGPEGFGMTILMEDASTSDAAKAKGELEKIIKDGRYFDGFIRNEPNGFVYQLTIDSTRTAFCFRKVKIQGGKQIIFQNPYMSKLSEEQALSYYEAIPD